MNRETGWMIAFGAIITASVVVLVWGGQLRVAASQLSERFQRHDERDEDDVTED